MPKTEFDYYYGVEAEQFTFVRVPKVLFTDKEHFGSLSNDARILYGFLLERMSLSRKNNLIDARNRVYIIFPIDEIAEIMGVCHEKALNILKELDEQNGIGLVKKKRRGLGLPSILYVKNFIINDGVEAVPEKPSNHSEPQERLDNNAPTSRSRENRFQEVGKTDSNNTDKNDTDFSDTDSFPFTSFRRDHGREAKGNEAALRERYREFIAENIAYDALLTDYPYEQDTLEEILELLVDVVCTTKSSVRISGDDKPAEVVRSQFLKLNSEHVRFVVGGLKENTTRIRNMRQYLLATLYNAPLTIGNYYRSLVSHDMSEGFI